MTYSVVLQLHTINSTENYILAKLMVFHVKKFVSIRYEACNKMDSQILCHRFGHRSLFSSFEECNKNIGKVY